MTNVAPTALRPTVKAGRNINPRVLIGVLFLFLAVGGFIALGFLRGVFFHETSEATRKETSTTVRSGADDLFGTVPEGYGWRKAQAAPAPVLVPSTVSQQQGANTTVAQAPRAPVLERAPMPLFYPAGSVHQAAGQAHSARQQQQAAMSQGGQGYAPPQQAAPSQQPQQAMGNRQQQFQASVAGNSGLYHGSTPEDMPLDACVVAAGTLIPAVLAHDVNPNMQGSVTVTTRMDVYDFTGSCNAIPAGSRIETTYDSSITYGQESLQVVSTILTLPDGRTMSLGGMTAGNAQGMAGIEVDVNNHNLRLFGTAVIGALIDAIPAAAGLEANVNVSTGAKDISSTGKLIVEREMKRPPSADPVLAGTEITIKVPVHLVMGDL